MAWKICELARFCDVTSPVADAIRRQRRVLCGLRRCFSEPASVSSGLGGNLKAQDARDFWQSEWQRQPRHEASLDRSGWGRPGLEERREWFGGRQPSGYSPVPGKQIPQVPPMNLGWTDGRCPAVRVTNPTFFPYTPDKLTNADSRPCASSRDSVQGSEVDAQDSTAEVAMPRRLAPSCVARPLIRAGLRRRAGAFAASPAAGRRSATRHYPRSRASSGRSRAPSAPRRRPRSRRSPPPARSGSIPRTIASRCPKRRAPMPPPRRSRCCASSSRSPPRC